MIEDLLQMRAHIDTMIETYKDLHPGSYELMDNGEYITHEDEIIIQEELEKETALKRIREGYYENKFRESKGKKTSRLSEGQSSLCVYGDT
tara:strand:- start:338 stop:610 length:273 start_codon:yes stop_codon:yes gene_type:complete